MAAPLVTNVTDVTNTTSKEQGLCLLSLDGGGIRGLSELIIIEELMERIKWHEKLDKPPIPADIFHLIGGTSTGGLIAILLGRLRLSAAEAIRHYETLAKVVFSEKKAKGKEGTFKASKLKEAIEEVLKKTIGPEHKDAKMYDEDVTSSKKCLAFVCAIGTSDMTHPAGPTLFRSYDVAKNKEYNCKIWEAARATSAAPTFFKRIKIGPSGSEIDYVDAGIGCNNPIKQVIAEAARVFGEEAPVGCIVSIGTGQSESVGLAQPDTFQNFLPTSLIKTLKEIATDSGRVAEEMELRYRDIPGLYSRFDVDRGLHLVSLAEWKEFGKVREYTKNYMKQGVIDRRVDHVVRALCGNCPDQNCKAGHLTVSVRPKTHTVLRINIPQKRVFRFVTRQRLLTDITDRLFNDDSPETVVLLAMGGAGKTQLALEVCRQAEQSSRFGAVIWVDASSPKSVIQSYKSIAQKILKQQADLDDEGIVRLRVQDALRDWDQQWLMVFDNYDVPQAFQGHSIRSYVPSGKSGRILFTSRHQDSARLGHKIDASTMTESESLELLLQRRPLNEDDATDGSKIVSTLGYLALAIDQAGAYICARSLDLKEFIQHYRDRKKVIHQEIPDEWEYSRAIDGEERENRLNIFTTWELSFKQISGQEGEVKDKEHFLTLAAFFDAGNVSERYFQAYFDESNPKWMKMFSSNGRWDSYKLGDILAEFQKLSLLQTHNRTNEGHFVSIHPVICDWIKLRKSSVEQKIFATELTTALTDYLTNIDTHSLVLATRLETGRHIDSCILSDRQFSQSSSQILDCLPSSVFLFAGFYREQARYNEADGMFRRALAINKEKLGATDPATLKTTQCLAVVLSMKSQYDEAERLYRQILVETEKEFGKVHPRTLEIVETFGSNCGAQSRYDEAESLLNRALKGNEEMLGSTHGETLRTVGSLANLYHEQGRYDEAATLYKRELFGNQEEYGETHLNTLVPMANLASVYLEQKRYKEAETFYERALSGYQEKLGETHPNTQLAMQHLAGLYWRQGRYKEAKDLYQRALAGRIETLGARHPDTLLTMHGLALMYRFQGRYDEAKELFQRALAGSIDTLGATHEKTLRTVKALAMTYRCLKQHEEAKELYKQALAGRTETLGATHPETLQTIYDLAVTCGLQGRYDEAKKHFQRALDGRIETLGATHERTLKTVKALAMTYRRLDQHKEAEELEERFPSA